MKITLGIGLCVLALQVTGQFYYKNGHHVDEVYKWTKVEYEYLPKLENSYIGPYRYYIPENNNIASLGYHPASGLMIVSIFRMRPGVPTNLGAFCVGDYELGSSPRIWGFPNYEINDLQPSDFSIPTEEERGVGVWNKPGDRSPSVGYYYNNPYNRFSSIRPLSIYGRPLERIVSTFHITVDERCNRVFFMDNGQVQYYKNATYSIQKPALWVIDLPANGCQTRNFPILRRTVLPDHIAARASNGFVQVTLDYQSDNSCEDLFVYITNTFYNFMVVYDYKNDDFWTFDHQTFQPVISESYFVFDNYFNYNANLGLFSVALGFPDTNGDRTAFYTKIAGTAQYSVSTRVLKNKANSYISFNSDDFSIMGYLGCNHQPVKTAIDYSYGVMFYTQLQSNQILCWNINKPLNPDNIGVVHEFEKFTLPIQIFVDSAGYLWFQSSYTPIIYASDIPLDPYQVSTRVFRIRVDEAIRGTVCEN
ncbi:L-dopachrome tautomerase yellow-f2-like [Phlebotomus papatasi]|uniref:L-dopachrome tautomerase yellow-f2-like n=1 Tax=Phlebotomus papatasi TaxID=29031 RepID=UPI002483BB24|nr:L-dopachrome tautomerase yellow-f2-like [Phlebotomus papatasi]